ncbi:MAG: DUF1493 family protein [Crocinitomicaceae bacterium]|nr:DUF1493 family protein [Crocinitomicaceae bacterium]
MGVKLEEILDFVAEHSGKDSFKPNVDIELDLGVYGDDWHEMMSKFEKKFNVDMSTYLWYFHSGEEGFSSVGALFFKPPYARVKRIPITPNDLLRIADNNIWDINYPAHDLPKRRYDLMINTALMLGIFIYIIYWIVS